MIGVKGERVFNEGFDEAGRGEILLELDFRQVLMDDGEALQFNCKE